MKPIKDRRKGQWLTLSAPLHARVLDRGMTVSHRIARSTVSAAVLSAPMRKVTRPRGRIARRLPFTADISPQNLIARLNQEEVSPAPPRSLPEVTNVREIAEVMLPDGLPVSIVDLLRKHRWLRWAPLALGLLVLLLLLLFSASLILIAAGAALAAGLAYLSWRLKTALTTIDQADSVLDEHRTPEAVDQLPASPDFRISDPDEGFEPSIGTGPDSAEAVRYKKALKDGNLMLQQSAIAGAKPVRWPLDLPALADTIFARLDPRVTVPDWVRAGIRIPPRIGEQIGGDFVEAMAYPVIDTPMYKPLADVRPRYFLPNINLIDRNSITLLETNQSSSNPTWWASTTNSRASCCGANIRPTSAAAHFRQFWDVHRLFDAEDLSSEQTCKEKLRDIPPMHRWLRRSNWASTTTARSPAKTDRGGSPRHPRRTAQALSQCGHLCPPRSLAGHDQGRRAGARHQ